MASQYANGLKQLRRHLMLLTMKSDLFNRCTVSVYVAFVYWLHFIIRNTQI